MAVVWGTSLWPEVEESVERKKKWQIEEAFARAEPGIWGLGKALGENFATEKGRIEEPSVLFLKVSPDNEKTGHILGENTSKRRI